MIPQTIDTGVEYEIARRSMAGFANHVGCRYDFSWHHFLICEYLDKFVRKEITRLIITAPPRHCKSDLGSRKCPAYILGINPDAQIISTAYSAPVAYRFSRDVQRIIDSESYRELFPDTQLSGKNIKTSAFGSYVRTAEFFEIVNHFGSYRAAGIDGGMTGMGADYIIIDDPIKNRKEAESKTYRDRVWDAYRSTILTRGEGNFGVLMFLTRWHDDDIAGRAIQLAEKEPDADQWVVVNLPAVLDCEPVGGDNRKQGEALWPDKNPLQKLNVTRATVGSYEWNALFQGRPMAASGNMFKIGWFQWYDRAPMFERIIQSWDTSNTDKDTSDYSVCTTWGETAERHYYLLFVYRKKLEYPDLSKIVKNLFFQESASGAIIENKGSGTSLIQEVLREGVSAIPYNPTVSKEIRARVSSPKIEAGRVFLPNDAHWLGDFLDEVQRFPAAKHDDQVDSMTQFLSWVDQGEIFVA